MNKRNKRQEQFYYVPKQSVEEETKLNEPQSTPTPEPVK